VNIRDRSLTLFGIIFGFVLFIVVAGEWLGLISTVTDRVPWPIGLGPGAGRRFPDLQKRYSGCAEGQVLAHTLMTVGVLAALLVGNGQPPP
jgi:P-type Cu+ transporter